MSHDTNQPLCESIPYELATPALQEQALSTIRQVFVDSFASLTVGQWQQAIARCYPVLEVVDNTVELREDDLTRLATYLSLYYTEADSSTHLAFCSASRHVAYKLVGFSRRAVTALEQAAALPITRKQEAGALYQYALESMIGGDAVANSITQAFAFRSTSLPPRRVHLPPLTSSIVELAPPTPSRARRSPVLEVAQQWHHLQTWYKQSNDPARPWNVSAIARQLQLNQSVLRALLTAPKGTPGFSRTAFSKARLKKLQRYFLPYGYIPQPSLR